MLSCLGHKALPLGPLLGWTTEVVPPEWPLCWPARGSGPLSGHRKDCYWSEAGEACGQLLPAICSSPRFPALTLCCAEKTQEQANGIHPSHPWSQSKPGVCRHTTATCFLKAQSGLQGTCGHVCVCRAQWAGSFRGPVCSVTASLAPSSLGRARGFKSDAQGQLAFLLRREEILLRPSPIRAVCPRSALYTCLCVHVGDTSTVGRGHIRHL